ncbi:rhodanese-like domain-containing protein [Pelomicrobium sp.]|jgi:rhodanese-related sulfurtransferase|uniref:rhodanese-like domain-containing protein n=1 Tax=Pelomicrobium sp. TaxID=2815319 RepID=UPI002FDDA533
MIPEILERARARARQMGLPYDGALTPAEAYQLMTSDPQARLVDVRTQAELTFVGRIPGAVEIEWQSYPGMQLNPRFPQELERQVDKNARVMFLCRSGGRSHQAAVLAKQLGYAQCYNVLEGFEGERDPQGHRNTVGGWRVAGLPWVQS